MGHCISMLRRKMTRRRQPPAEPFVVRGGRLPPAVAAESFGQLQLQKRAIHGGGSRGETTRPGRHGERFRHEVDPGVLLDGRRCAPKLVRLPCRGTCCGTTAVEPVATDQERPLTEGSCRTPVAPPMTPMRPVWQRRILMGMRCELPRFSGLILYDEHGRPIRGSTPGRSHPQWKKRTAKAGTTLRDLL
ncbi:uncharacterized protein LOC107303375 [Oryza brachyantha]|uniref:uncharacterized protein LOC107303375 n=1 Tax=Oryza brachyantha TaxID=4533 RepID=UPI001ADB784C|nr:uncharacterized protein LOC107303375 [Oryza brachyantha]